MILLFSSEETSLVEYLAELDKRQVEAKAQAKDADEHGPAANTRQKAKCKVCCSFAHCEYKFHFPSKVKMEELPYAMEKEMLDMKTLCNMEEIEKPDEEVNDMTGLLNSVNIDISTVFGTRSNK